MTEPRIVHVRFFAVLREQAGMSLLDLTTAASTPGELYRELQKSHRLSFDETLLRVAVNERYVSMDTPFKANDQIVFIPPVAGG